MLSKGGPGGVLRAPKGAKVRNGDQQRVFKIVKITLVFIAFLSRRVSRTNTKLIKTIKKEVITPMCVLDGFLEGTLGSQDALGGSQGGSRGGP